MQIRDLVVILIGRVSIRNAQIFEVEIEPLDDADEKEDV
jgi:hypothetical protein